MLTTSLANKILKSNLETRQGLILEHGRYRETEDVQHLLKFAQKMKVLIAADSFNWEYIKGTIEQRATFNQFVPSQLLLDIFESCDGKKLSDIDAVIVKHNQLAVAVYINTNKVLTIDKSAIDYDDILKLDGYSYVIDLDIQVDNTLSYLPFLLFGAFAFGVFALTRQRDD